MEKLGRRVQKISITALQIMIIDDDVDIGEWIDYAVAQSKHRPVFFQNPRQAVAAFHENQTLYQAIFTDLSMPEMSGQQVIEAIRKDNTTVPIIIISGNPDMFSNEDCARLNVLSVVSKPFRLQDISRAIKRFELYYQRVPSKIK